MDQRNFITRARIWVSEVDPFLASAPFAIAFVLFIGGGEYSFLKIAVIAGLVAGGMAFLWKKFDPQ